MDIIKESIDVLLGFYVLHQRLINVLNEEAFEERN